MMTTTILKIDGMTCGHCRAAVETAIQNVEGVRSARVDPEAGEAQVLHDAAADGQGLVEAIRKAGFEARAEGA